MVRNRFWPVVFRFATLLCSVACIIYFIHLTKVQTIERYLRGISSKAHALRLTTGSYQYIAPKNGGNEFVRHSPGYAESPEIILNVNDNGNVAILWKKEIGWKGNYTGYVFHDSEYSLPIETVPDYQREVIAVDFETIFPFIKKKLHANLIEVYFDLM